MMVVKKQYNSVNFDKGYVTALRQRIYQSLDDGRSETVAGERKKLARLDRARAAMGRLFHACREVIVGRPPVAAGQQQQIDHSICRSFWRL
jgi:hypothetical protein